MSCVPDFTVSAKVIMRPLLPITTDCASAEPLCAWMSCAAFAYPNVRRSEPSTSLSSALKK
jgi:hypothetical protein